MENQLLFFLQAEQGRFLGLSAGEWVSFIIVTVGIAVSYAKLSEQVEELKRGRTENKEAIKEIRAQLDEHTDNENMHINARIYAELMRRFDTIERKIESGTQQIKNQLQG